MPPGMVPIGEAARRTGLSVDTIRRWERAGRIRMARSPGGVRLLTESQVNALARSKAARPAAGPALTSARNRLPGVITGLKVSGLLAEVTLNVDGREVVALITSESARALKLRVGTGAVAVIKAPHVIIERER